MSLKQLFTALSVFVLTLAAACALFASEPALINPKIYSAGVINIPAPVLRTIWLKNLDGTARVGQELTVEPYVHSSNHCGVHVSYRPHPQAKLTSDFEGKVQFFGSLLTTWAEIDYLTRRDAVSKGERAVWAINSSLELSAAQEQTVSQQWEVPGVARDYQISVLDGNGKGIAGLTLVAWDAINTCGIASQPIGQSDASGRIGVETTPLSVQLNFETIDTLQISHAATWEGKHLYEFSDVEIAELIRFGTLNVRLLGTNL